ncbi:MAG: DUF4443 domain-containing protein [Nitrososphaeria archaeon]
MSLRKTLEDLAAKRYIGPTEAFDFIHIALLIYYLGESAPKSRSELSKFLGLGEGSIRTILKRLKSKAMIKITRDGVVLDNNGVNLYKELKNVFPTLVSGSFGCFSLDQFSAIVQIRSAKNKVIKGLEQRDEAIKYGAKAAITLVYKEKCFRFPDANEGYDICYPLETWSKILNAVTPDEGDVVIICSADSSYNALRSCIAAALTLSL